MGEPQKMSYADKPWLKSYKFGPYALKKTLASQNQDSPVFQLLPELKPADPTKFLGLPLDFKEEVRRAESSKNTGYLQMLSAEADGFAWTTMGLRLIGKAQFKLKDWQGARATWEAVRKYEDTDLEANTFLGTVYQRLGDLVRSDQALQRALQDRDMSRSDRAELWALMARNAKILWEANWKQVTGVDEIQKEALASPHLKRSFDLYCKGFTEDRNHFYSGLNALAMLTIMTELAVAQPAIWEDDYDSTEEAGLQLRKLTALRLDLAGGIRLAIESRREALACEDQTDIWAEISGADLIMLRSSKPKRVGRAYKTALAGAPDIASDSARQQLLHYQTLGILTENTRAALDNIPVVKPKQETPETVPHVILFTGHRIDAPDRRKPRFPHQKENQARDMILAAVSRVKETATGQLLGISGGASGGDILFHEICEELEIPTKMYLAIPKQKYINASVADGGFNWVERFNRLLEEKQPEILSASGELPRWLHAKKGYSIWQRANMWMLYSAMAISGNKLILIALWNGESGDGPGGIEDMVRRAQDLGAPLIHISARQLVE